MNDLGALRSFLAAARHEHFTRAAEELFLSQPSLSQQIGRLEADLGTALFHRIGRGVRLTEAGRALMPLAERLLAEAEEARRTVRQVAGLEAGILRLCALPALDQYLLPPLLAGFRRAHPGIGLRVREVRPARAVAQEVFEGKADLGFLHLPCPVPGLRTLELLEDRFLLVLPPEHALAERESIGLSEASGLEFVWVTEAEDPLHPLYAACVRAGFAPRIACLSGSSQGVLALVAAGLGAALLPALAVEDRPGLTSVPVADPGSFRSLAVVWVDGGLSPAAARLLEQCRARWPGVASGAAPGPAG